MKIEWKSIEIECRVAKMRPRPAVRKSPVALCWSREAMKVSKPAPAQEKRPQSSSEDQENSWKMARNAGKLMKNAGSPHENAWNSDVSRRRFSTFEEAFLRVELAVDVEGQAPAQHGLAVPRGLLVQVSQEPRGVRRVAVGRGQAFHEGAEPSVQPAELL